MSELILHPASKNQIDTFVLHPTHALIIIGSEGMGKSAVSRHIAAHLLGRTDDKESLEKYPYLKIIQPADKSIPIEEIRGLLPFTKLKILGDSGRLIIIDHGHLLTRESQNALLKLLEEPPIGTTIIITATSDQALLPTIRSRAQMVTLQAPARTEIDKYFSKLGHSEDKIRQAYFMSGGLPGLMNALLQDDEEHPLMSAVSQARTLLKAKPFERLTLVDTLSKQRPECLRILFMLQQMAHAALEQAAASNTSNSSQTMARWKRIMHASYDAEVDLIDNVQPKLVLTNLMLSL